MEVLNAAIVTPVSSLHKPTTHTADRKPEPRRLFPLKLPKLPSFTSSNSQTHPVSPAALPRGLFSSLAALSAALAGPAAKALTYEEALQQSLGDSPSSSSSFGGGPDIDITGLVNGIVKFASENPLVVGGGALAVAVPLILSQILGGKPKPYGIQSARGAYAKLEEDAGAQLLDIREGKEFKESGSPDVKGLKKKAVSIAYGKEDKPGFLKKLALKFKDPENTTLYILDKFDGNSELVAELVTLNGFKAAYAIKDGAEGPRGWKNSGLPWSPPKKTISVDFGDLQSAISEAFGGGSDGLPVTLGLAAATGLGVLAFSEIETVLQLLGSAAIVQFATKKLLFAQDRKVTLQQIDEFLNTKIAPKELVDEIKSIGIALLPVSTTAQAGLPAPTEEKPVEVTSEVSKEAVAEATVEPPQETNSVPAAAVQSEPHAGIPRPLSPYPYYPDYKPPSSPSPSPP